MLNKMIPISIKKMVKRVIRKNKWKGNTKYICLSMQRSGTTSVSDFFKHFNYPVAGYNTKRNSEWSKKIYDGDFESVFRDKEFKSYQMLDDNPWWYPEFYKVLYHRLPNAKFVLMTRDSDDWFQSMQSHSDGRTLGNTRRHCKVYRRETEYYFKLDNQLIVPSDTNDNQMNLEGFKDHYISIYENRNREIINFFNEKNSDRLFYCNLYDKNKWMNLGNFIGEKVPENFEVHSNKSI